MKRTMKQLEEKNKPMGFEEVIFRNCFLEVDHICYLDHSSPVPLDTQLEILPRNTKLVIMKFV